MSVLEKIAEYEAKVFLNSLSSSQKEDLYSALSEGKSLREVWGEMKTERTLPKTIGKMQQCVKQLLGKELRVVSFPVKDPETQDEVLVANAPTPAQFKNTTRFLIQKGLNNLDFEAKKQLYTEVFEDNKPIEDVLKAHNFRYVDSSSVASIRRLLWELLIENHIIKILEDPEVRYVIEKLLKFNRCDSDEEQFALDIFKKKYNILISQYAEETDQASSATIKEQIAAHIRDLDDRQDMVKAKRRVRKNSKTRKLRTLLVEAYKNPNITNKERWELWKRYMESKYGSAPLETYSEKEKRVMEGQQVTGSLLSPAEIQEQEEQKENKKSILIDNFRTALQNIGIEEKKCEQISSYTNVTRTSSNSKWSQLSLLSVFSKVSRATLTVWRALVDALRFFRDITIQRDRSNSFESFIAFDSEKMQSTPNSISSGKVFSRSLRTKFDDKLRTRGRKKF